MESLSLLEKVFLNYELNIFLSRLVGVIPLIVAIVGIIVDFKLAAKSKEDTGKVRLFGVLIGIVLICLIAFNVTNSFTNWFTNPDVKVEGGIYFGETTNGIADGYGRLYYDDNHKIMYIGYFKNGDFEGKGKRFYIEKSGDSKEIVYLEYDGEHHKGYRNGKGLHYLYVNGEERLCYDGEYLLGELNGHAEQAVSYYEDGSVKSSYIGGFAYGNKYGYGTYIRYDERGNYSWRYRGVFWNDLEHGKGILEYIAKSGKKDVYVGYFADGVFDGEGVIYASDGTILEEGIYENDELKEEKDLSESYPFPDDCIW